METYGEAVAQFAKFLDEQGMPTTPAGIHREHVEAFVAYLRERFKPATANNRYRSLQQYFSWLKEEGEIKDSPMVNMKPPRVPDDPPDVLRDEDITALLKSCSGNTFVDRRDTAIIRLLLDTGARRSELTNMRVDEIDWKYNEVRVVGKNGKERVLSFGRKTARDLDRYLRARASHRDASEPWLWLGRHGRMTPSGIYQVVRDRAAKIGLTAWTHLFRHTNAHVWLAGGGSEQGLMSLMGWDSRSMVGHYAKSAASERARAEHRRLSLGDRF